MSIAPFDRLFGGWCSARSEMTVRDCAAVSFGLVVQNNYIFEPTTCTTSPPAPLSPLALHTSQCFSSGLPDCSLVYREVPSVRL
jgi:hypothetical protein